VGTVNVVVVADSEASASRLEARLDGGPDGSVAVVGRAEEGRSAVELVRRLRPDVVVVDLGGGEPPRSPAGLATIRELPRVAPTVRILALGDGADADLAVAALTAGAHGYLARPTDPAGLLAPVRAVASGHSVLNGPLLSALVGSAVPRDRELLGLLNPQYRELWRMVADGLETTQIAERLYVSERTAKRMVAFLLRRLRVANRIQAAALAGQAGLLDDRPATATVT
jgi:two-component system, NarL family, nitrate/nitrite response regulator NarL